MSRFLTFSEISRSNLGFTDSDSAYICDTFLH